MVSPAEVSDEALMLRYQRGDRGAFALLIRRHQSRVYNFMLRQLGSALAADEMAQQVFLGVVREAARFNYETPFSTRLFSIACSLAQKERSRMPARAGQDEAPSSGVSTPPALEESIERAVGDLPDEQKDVFLLREVADLRFSEIASITQRTESSVKMQMQQALQRLRAALQQFEEYRRALR